MKEEGLIVTKKVENVLRREAEKTVDMIVDSLELPFGLIDAAEIEALSGKYLRETYNSDIFGEDSKANKWFGLLPNIAHAKKAMGAGIIYAIANNYPLEEGIIEVIKKGKYQSFELPKPGPDYAKKAQKMFKEAYISLIEYARKQREAFAAREQFRPAYQR